MECQNPFFKFFKIVLSLFASSLMKICIHRPCYLAPVFSDLSILRRRIVIAFFIFSTSMVAFGQVNGDYQTRATGDWNDNNTWQVYSGGWADCTAGDYPGAAPGAGTVYITGNYTVSVTADVPEDILSLEFIGASETNLVQFSGAYNINITGAITINPPTGGTNDNGIYVNSGIVTCASLTSSNSASDSRDCKVGISTGTLTINGNIAMGNNVNRNDITFSDAGILNVTGNLITGRLTCVANSNINIGGALTPAAFTVSTSNVNYNGADQNISSYTYYNLSTSGSGIKTLPNGNVTVSGSLDVSNSTLAFTASAARTLIVTEDLSGNGTIDMSPGNFTHSLNLGGASNSIGTLTTAAALSYVNYNGAGDQIIFSSPNYRYLRIYNAGNKTLGGDVTVGGSIRFLGGKIVLGAFDLTLTSTNAVIGYSSARYIVAEGLGQFKKVFYAGATGWYYLPVGDAVNYSPVRITYVANSVQRTIGVRITDLQHPNDGTVDDFISRYWSFTDDQAGTYTYSSTFTYITPDDLTGIHGNLRVNRWDGSIWTQYNTSGGSPTITVTGVTETTAPLNNSEFTGRVNPPETYRWNQTGAVADWTVPANWTPARLSPQTNDILIFDGNGTTTANNIPNETIERLVISNTSDVTLEAAAVRTLTINDITGTELDIDAGNSLTIGTNLNLTLAAGSSASIDGTLTINPGRVYTTNAAGTVTTVSGTILNQGTVTTSATGLVFNAGSIYDHNLDGGIVPTATWDVASNCNLTGLAAARPGGLNQTFGNFNYNSPYIIPLAGNLTVTGNLDISAGGINGQTRTINLTGDLTGTGDLSFTSGRLNITGDYTNSGIFTYGTTSTVDYNGTAQQVKSTDYYSLIISGGDVKTLLGAVQVNGTLTLTSGVLQLNAFHLTLNNTIAIGGSPFSLTNMIETNDAGRLIRSANATNQSFNGTYPVGSGGFYNPFIISGLPNSVAAARSLSVGAVPVNLFVVTNSINKYWDISSINLTTAAGTILSFEYNAGEIVGDPLLFQPYTDGSGSWALATGPSFPGSNPATSTGSATITGFWTVGSPSTFYSYQSGFWDQASTWTFDPGGTTGPGTLVPGDNDKVVILSGRTVTLQADDFTQNLDITINDGGILDQSIFGFFSTLTALRGSGFLMLSSSLFPTATINTFVTTDGGTTEYNYSGPMSATQSTYYHLSISSAGTVTQVNNVILNGNLHIKQGIFQINDATPRRLQLVINGNVTVDNLASIGIGTGNTRSNPGPVPAITGSTGGFLNYYENNSHRIQVYGDFINDGIVRFSNLLNPVYNSFPGTGFASVYFQGANNNILTCNGQTDFYNLIVDKGIDQTFTLTVNSSDYSNFRLFGANTSDGSVTLPVSPAGNPNLKKALWIKNGTLVLQGLVAIPSLSEGATAGAYPSHFFIPVNGAMKLDGAGVIVLSTADDYTEVNAAYGLAGGSNAAYGINTTGGYSGISILGKLEVNNGYLSTRESSGFLYWSYGPGQLIINGGKVDAKQFHDPQPGAVGLISFVQNSGDFIIRGRFRNNISYAVPADLANATINTTRISNSIDPAAGTGSFSINSNLANAYTITGGTISIYDVCNTTATPLAFLVNCPVSNINVTGGTLQIIPTTGTVLPDANYLINSTAQVGNLIINRVSGATSVQLNTNPLVALSDLTITSGSLIANNMDVTVGGNFLIASGTTYTAGTNLTTFNGTGNQTFTVNLAAPLSLNKVTIDKPSGIALNFAGSQTIINIASDFSLVLGTLNDNGNTINIAGNVYNSGTHSGAGRIVLNGTLTQSIDGNGIFNHFELNNTNAAAAPVSLAANCTINGSLTFSQNKLFNINTFNLRLNSGAVINNGGTLRYIQSAGNAGDGGLTKVYSSPVPFDFPVGVVNYTPATIGLSVAPTAYGSITVIPVNFAHPNVTTPGRSLSYFWRTKSTGFTLGAATVTHGYTYNQANVVTGAGITEDEYIAARFEISTSSWTSGTAADVDEALNIVGEPGTGSFLENVTFIDGDYTAGDNNPTNPFGIPQIFYSRINGAGAGSGLWSSVNTWSTDPVLKHTGAAAVTVPGINDIVIIGALDSVYLATDVSWPYTTPNVDPRSCASLQIEAGSALDIGYNPASTFGMVLSHPGGNGNFRFTTSSTSGNTYIFPAGDFSDFNVNLGTTEIYSTNPGAGTTYWLPNGTMSYGNLILSPLGGSNIIFPNNDLTIFGNLVTRGQNADSWFCPTWNGNYPTAPVVRVPKTITINGDLDIQGGALIWYGNGAIAQDIVVYGDVIISTLSALDVWSGATSQTIAIGGSLINNADGLTHGLTTRSKADFTLLPLTFFGSSSASITSTVGTPLTVFQYVTIDKGSSQATTLTCDIAGTLTTLTNNWLTLQNGTFRYMRTDPSTDFTISTTTPFSIPATAGLYIDLPSNVGNRNILIGNANNNNGDLLLSGKLTLINGNIYVGRTPGTDNNNNDIEYTTSGASAIDIQGGYLQVNGQVRRDPLNAGGILKYSQSGGVVKINGQASNGTNAKLEVVNIGSDFTMSGGTLTIVRGNGAITTPSSPFGDLYLRPQTGSVTGGTIDFSHTGINIEQNYYLDATIPLFNITISGVSAARYSAVRLLISPLTVDGNMTINTNSVLNSNNINVTFNGNLINTPGVAGYFAGTNLTTFSALSGGPYAGVQTITGATDFYDLVVNPGVSVTLNNASTINRNLTLSTGTYILGGNPVTLLGDLTNDASYTDDNSVGSGIILNGTALQHITGFGAYARLTLNNATGAGIENNITIQEDLTMTLGILDIKKNLVTLGVNSLIQGAPFGATKMITSDGVFSNVGLRKFFNPGATTFLYPIGTSGKYTPAQLTITASSTVGYVRINNISSTHPAVIDPANALDYYWEVQSSGITGFSGNLILNYLQGDVVGDEPNYKAARLIVPGTSWSKTLGCDPALNTITFNYITSNNLSGEYTAGIDAAFPANVPQYTSNADGNWTNPAIWTQTGGDPYVLGAGGPNGFIVIVNHEVTLDANYCSAYRITINNKLKVTATFYGHNLGTVNGSGTLYLENGSFPAGVYTSFLGCSNFGTVEYGGTGTYTIIADLYDDIRNVIFSGTGTRVLPNKDLTICNQLKIDGPTLDNSIYNKKLIIKGTMERYNTGALKSGNGAGATVSFAGTGLQTIGGAFGDFIGTNAFNNLEINNSAGLTIDDPGAIEVKGKLLLTNGLINTGSTRTLTITNVANNCVVPAGGSSSSFVNGPLIKKISQYDNFLFPLGISGTPNLLGNKIKLSSTQTGPLLWSAEYKSPNGTSGSFTAPLVGVSNLEYYTVKVGAGSQTILNLNWTPSSDVNPIITGGMSNIRLAKYDTGTSKWIEIPTTSSGNDSNGTATSVGVVTSTGSDDYTLGSITDLKPRAKLSPTGPICGATGIPVTFTAPYAIPFDYTLNYKIDGVPQIPVTITPGDIPYSLPTPTPGVYQLTDFKYNSGASTGVVDPGTVTAYAEPTTADAGPDQTLCGITTATLDGNTPLVFTFKSWSIVSGTGGTLLDPTNPVGDFIGLNGSSYILRWTIQNGTCESIDDVIINFTILPDPPAASATQDFCGSATIADLVATPPVGCTVDWWSAASGGVLLPPATVLISGTTYYAESNGGAGCVSASRTAVLVTINPVPIPGLIGPNIVCDGSTGNVYTTEADKFNYSWVVVGGFITSGGLGTDNTATVTWNTPGPQSISVNYELPVGCSAASPTVYNVTVNDEPTITLGGNPSVCSGITSANLTYSATTGSPNQYSIDYDAAAEAVGFVDVPITTVLPGSPISLIVPGAAVVGTYNGNLSVKNSITGCVSGTYGITVTIIANNTASAPSSTPTLCINTALTAITHTTTGATGIGAPTGLPAGVAASWLADVITISGTPTESGTFNYSIPLTGGCGTVNATGTIIVTPDADITSVTAGTTPQCIGGTTTYTANGVVLGGGTGAWSSDDLLVATVDPVTGVVTAIGAGTCNITYTITGGCNGTPSASQPYTVTPDASITSVTAGTTPQCIGGTTTYTANGVVLGGGTGAWSSDDILVATVNPLTGLVTAVGAGTCNITYTITGGCNGTPSASQPYTVTPENTTSGPSSTPTLCINTVLTDITHTTTGATGIGAAVGLPAGVTASWLADVITISGTPTESGTFNYSIPLTGGCGTVNAIGTIIVNPIPTVTITDPAAVCAPSTVDLTDAAITAGSTAGLTFTYWTDALATVVYPTETAATDGTYYIKGTDGSGCYDIQPVTVIINPVPTLVITDPAAVCSPSTVDLTDPAVTAGSDAGLTFTYWTDAAATISYTTETAATTGTYYIKGTDGSGCYDIQPVIVIVNAVPTVTSTQTDVLCYGESTGAIDITVAGGTGPYTYAWTGTGVTATSEDQTDLAAGLYSVIVTDGNSCSSASLPLTITEPVSAVNGSITSQTDVSVFGGNDGNVTVAGSGGTPPYQYSLDGGTFQISGTFGTLTAGSYTVTVEDANFCTFDVTVTITEPVTALSGNIISLTDVDCFGSATGSVTVDGSGGVTPYEFSLDGGAYQSSGTFGTLAEGIYTVTIRDAALTTFDIPVTITEPASALSVATTQTDNVCYGGTSGTATATASGGTSPYDYSWDTTPVQSSATATGLITGTYTVTVTDANGCINYANVTISEPSEITISISQVNVLCNGGADGTATASAVGGSGSNTYSWDTSPVQTNATATGLVAGTYTVTVTDVKGCTNTETVQITEPTALALDATPTNSSCPDTEDGEIALAITGGTSPYIVIWADGITTQNRTNLLPGTDSVVVTDANGCAESLSIDVGYDISFNCLVIPDIITPNHDGYNDEWIITNIDMYPDAEVRVFNRWGRMIYRERNILSNPWDGTFKGKLVPTDSYHYILDLNDGSQPRSGVISVIREE